jgi:hypothetical protein
MNSQDSNPDTDTSLPSARSSDSQSRASLGWHISPKIVDVLALFIRQTLSVEPHIKAYQSLWECEWSSSAGELSILLNSDGGDFYLHVLYLASDEPSPIQHLQPADIQRLCQQLVARTGLPAHASG